MLVLLSCSLLFMSFALLVLWQRLKEGRAHKLPPKIKGELPIIGLTPLVLIYGRKLFSVLQRATTEGFKKGDIIYGHFGTDLYYFIGAADDGFTALSACHQKHFGFDFWKFWLGDGLVTSAGEYWKRHRKLLAPAFNQRVVNNFIGMFNNQAKILNQDFARHIDKEPFDHMHSLKYWALQTFCITGVGLDGYEDKKFMKVYTNTVDTLFKMTSERVINVWQHSDFLYRLFGYQKKLGELSKTLDRMSDEILQKKKIDAKNRHLNTTRGEKAKPFMDLILELSEEDALTDKEISDEVKTVIVAGYETVSNTLAIILVMIGRHPDVQEKLYEELLQVLGPEKDVLKDDLPRLVYTEAVIKESMRLYPVATFLARYVDKDVKLTNYTMRAGSQCFVTPYAIHRNPVWGPDADEFKPDRWLDPAKLPDNPNAFSGFGIGNRSCVGKNYAMMVMKVTLAHLLRRCKIWALKTKEINLTFDILLKLSEGQEISVTART